VAKEVGGSSGRSSLVAAEVGGQSSLATSAEHWNPAAWMWRWRSLPRFATRSASPRWNRTWEPVASGAAGDVGGGLLLEVLPELRCSRLWFFCVNSTGVAAFLRWRNNAFLPTALRAAVECERYPATRNG
jgi:hypothetical protein